MQLTATLDNVFPIAENTFEAVFTIPNPEFKFRAGQYVSVTLPRLKDLPVREQFRDFSIASSPDRLPQLAISFRASESLFKKTLITMKPGDSVLISGPSGIFTLPEDSSRTLAFIAGGIGIDPFFSMIQFVAEHKLPHRITLIYCNRSAASAAYLADLENVVKEYPNIRMVTKFGPLEEKDIREVMAPGSLWYVAGPPGMVHAARVILNKTGIIDSDIKTEEFSGYL